MNELTFAQIKALIATMTEIILVNEVAFCELDSAAGDGDFGMSIAKGFRMVKEGWPDLDQTNIGSFMSDCGMIITEHCGGASGPIWGSAFRAFGKKTRGSSQLTLSELAEAMQVAVDAIQKRGGAKLGDKTLLDALIPTVESLKASAAAGMDLPDALKAGAAAAREGAEKTRLMVASRGRASYVGERSLSYPDAGAMALGIIFTGMAKEADRFFYGRIL
jgi:phosphoenolpyruvate---glycerone phosphotransferase subunit DhaL